MHVVEHGGVEPFLARAGPWLERAEAENAIFFRIGTRLLARPAPARLLTVEEGGVVSVALQTPGRKWIVTRAGPSAIACLVTHLRERSLPVPGVLGPADVARSFAELWTEQAGVAVRSGKPQRIYELRDVAPLPEPSGRARLATWDDLAVVVPWGRAFATEVGTDEGPEENAAMVRLLVAEARLHVWDDGGPVAMAAEIEGTPRGGGVSAVYTPRERRGRGYAAGVVATVSRRILGSGRQFAYLFTDLGNPASNRLYVRIGYRPVGDWADYFFD